MNKNIKKVIAVALTLSAFAAISPATEYNLFTTKAYASDDDDENTEDKLDKLKLETSSGKSIQLYDDKDMGSSDKIDDDEVDEGDTYYAKTSSSKISISTSGPKSKYVRVFKGTSSSTKGKKTSSDISLSSGTNTIVVRIYSEEPDSSPKYSDDDDVIGTYTIKVKYTGSDDSDSDDDDSNDDIYLDRIKLSEGDISFSKNTTSYNIKVDDDVDEIKITAEPDDSDDEVRIDGSKVDEDDDWKKTVDLEKGKNKIEITVEDDDDNKRTYTLNITRGQVSTTSEKIYLDTLKVGGTSLKLSEEQKDYNLKFKSETKKIQIYADHKDSDYTVTIDGTEVKSKDGYKKNVELEDGKVQSFKVKVKNSSGNEQVYTLNIGRGDDLKASDFPTISTGTANNNTTNNTSNNNSANANNGQSSNTTVINNSNANKWITVNGKWQYNDASGNPLKSQWFYDSNYGKEYYLDQYGNMATGWLQLNGNWYYLGSDGGKKTGWQYDGSAWYYMDGRGVMLKNTVVGGYRLQANGAWDWK